METLLWAIFGVTAFLALVTCVAVALAIRAVRRSNRVVPEVPSRAPLAWRASLRHHARLHRQLQATVAAVRAAQRTSTSQLDLSALVAQVEAHACTLDDQLTIAACAPSSQRVRLLQELDGECEALNDTARRIIAMSRQERTAGGGGLEPVRERLDALEAALAELGGEPGRGRQGSSS